MNHFLFFKSFSKIASQILCVSVVLCSFVNVSLANDKASEKIQVKTSMNTVTDLLKLKTCKNTLNALASELIGTKEHRLLSYSKQGDKELFNALMVLEYHDRTAHVNFSAMAKADGTCDANYTSSFFVNVPCALAREEVIKRFIYVGQLSGKTQIFKHKRKPHLQAMISPANRGRGCLVTHKTQ